MATGKKIGSIGSVELEENERSERLQEQWEQYLQQLDEALQSDDPLSSPLVQKVMLLARHLFGKLNREEALRLVDFLRERNLVDLKKAHAPSVKQLLPIFAQAIGAFAGFGLGITPLVAGYTGSQAQGYQSGSALAQNLLVTGGGSVGHLTNSMQQGEQTEKSQKIQATQRILGDHDQSQKREQQAAERASEDQRKIDQQRHETFGRIAQS